MKFNFLLLAAGLFCNSQLLWAQPLQNNTIICTEDIVVEFSTNATTIEIYQPFEIECTISNYDFESVPDWFLYVSFYLIPADGRIRYVADYIAEK